MCVLVPGAWLAGGVWDEVASSLRDRSPQPFATYTQSISLTNPQPDDPAA